MAITACAAKFSSSCDLLVGEWPYFLAIDIDRADQLVVLEHRNGKHRARASELNANADLAYGSSAVKIRNVNDLCLVRTTRAER